MNNKIFVSIIISFFLTSQLVYANDSRYSQSLSRMEREWLHKEFNTDSDEERITRLEEKVFGTIHDVNIQTRYKQLRRAFDVQKEIQQKHRWYNEVMSGIPTSVPMNIDGLVGE